MFIRVVLSAKIGKDYQCREIGCIMGSNGRIQIDFPKDMDMTVPFTMICEPSLTDGFQNADNQGVGGFGEGPLNPDISEIHGYPVLKKHTETLLEKEAKRPVYHYDDPADEPKPSRQVIKKAFLNG